MPIKNTRSWSDWEAFLSISRPSAWFLNLPKDVPLDFGYFGVEPANKDDGTYFTMRRTDG